MLDADVKTRIMNEVDRRFDEQTKVLADLVKIFHPSLMTDRTFEWYMQVPAR